MASASLILLLSFLFLQLATAIALISSEECGEEPNGVKLLNLKVDPDPIIAPGLVSIKFTIHTSQNLTRPLKAKISLARKASFLGYVSIPCALTGSCEYVDLCDICTVCNCPMAAGEHTLNLPIKVDSDSWLLNGNYRAKINLETTSGDKDCVTINNINIAANK